MKKAIAVLALALLTAVAAYATTIKCNLDNFNLMWTGSTKIDSRTSTMLYEHKCINDHYYWLTQQQMNR